MSADNCNKCNKDRFHFLGFDSSAQKVVVTGEIPINVQEIVTTEQTTYNVTYLDHEALLASLDINSIVTTPNDTQYKNGSLPLKGVTVNELTLGWQFIQDGQSVDVYQEINGVQVSPNTVKTLNATGLSLTFDSLVADRTYTLFGDDGTGLEFSTVTVQKILEFGNRCWFGEGPFENDDNALRSLLTTLDESIRLDPNITITPTSLAGDVYVYAAIPTDIATNIVFQDLSSPVDTDPMKTHRTNFSLSNGFISDTYTVYISKQSALRGSIITPKTWQ